MIKAYNGKELTCIQLSYIENSPMTEGGSESVNGSNFEEPIK